MNIASIALGFEATTLLVITFSVCIALCVIGTWRQLTTAIVILLAAVASMAVGDLPDPERYLFKMAIDGGAVALIARWAFSCKAYSILISALFLSLQPILRFMVGDMMDLYFYASIYNGLHYLAIAAVMAGGVIHHVGGNHRTDKFFDSWTLAGRDS